MLNPSKPELMKPKMYKRQFSLLLLTLFLSTTLTTLSQAADWPQWMGPKRDNVWYETGILKSFPKGGPKVLWRTPIQIGYAGPAVAQGVVVITDYVTSENIKVENWNRKKFSGIERTLGLNEKTGEILWTYKYPVKYAISYPSGPRCTPIIEKDRVYILGAEGHLACLNLKDGKEVWKKELTTEYKTKTALWGYANHPLIDGDRLICIVGGEGSHCVAFNKLNGEEIWRTQTAQKKGYCPPTIKTIHGVRQLLLMRPDALTAVSPHDGKELWSVPYYADSGSIIMSPVAWKDYVYVAGYNNRNMLVKIKKDPLTAEIVFKDVKKKAMSPVNVQPFLVDNILYGFDQKGFMHAVDLPSGDRLWETTAPIDGKRRPHYTATAFIVKNNDRFWLFNERGELIICNLTPKGYKEIDRAKVIEPTNVARGRDVVWSMPAFANKRAYIRNDKEIICVDLEER